MARIPATGCRRRLLVVLVIVVGLVVLLAAGAGYRYWRHHRIPGMLAEAGRAVDSKVSDAMVRRDLKAHLAYVEARLPRVHLKDILLGWLDREASRLYRACLGRVTAPHLLPGHHVLVTVSKVDGAELPTSVNVPRGWNGCDALQLVLDLHAAGVREMVDCFPVEGFPGALCARPLARGSHDYMGVQLTAVEECVADIQSRYPVYRIYVIGSSMGGLGAWLYGLRHVTTIGGISPWMANADPDAWKGLWEEEGERFCSPAGRACAMAQRARAPIARAEQVQCRPDLAIYVGHGADDPIVPVEHSNSMVRKLRKHELKRLRYDRFPELGHGKLPVSRTKRIEWLMDHDRGKEARDLVAIVPPLTFVANCTGITADERHIQALPVPPHHVLDPLKEAKVVVRAGKVAGGVNAAAAGESGPSKWHYPGPAGRAFEHPFSVDLPWDAPVHLRQCVDELAAVWAARCGGPVRRSGEHEGFKAFPREFAGEPRTLIALGSLLENPAVQEAMEETDAWVTAREVTLFGHTFKGEDIGLIMLRPHPKDFRAATLVIWGSTPAAYKQLWRRFGHVVSFEGDRGRWWFDYAVFDRRTCGPDSYLAVGFFDHQWHYAPALLFEGSRELRARIPGSHWPTGDAAGRKAERAPLSALPPESIESLRGPVAFDRSAWVDVGALVIQGQAFERGISMVPPATVRWRLGGRYAQFRAKVGLEHTGDKFPARHEAEKVQFEVWADDRCVATSPVLSSTDGLADIAADIQGADLLELRAVCTTYLVWHYGPVGWGDAELVP